MCSLLVSMAAEMFSSTPSMLLLASILQMCTPATPSPVADGSPLVPSMSGFLLKEKPRRTGSQTALLTFSSTKTSELTNSRLTGEVPESQTVSTLGSHALTTYSKIITRHAELNSSVSSPTALLQFSLIPPSHSVDHSSLQSPFAVAIQSSLQPTNSLTCNMKSIPVTPSSVTPASTRLDSIIVNRFDLNVEARDSHLGIRLPTDPSSQSPGKLKGSYQQGGSVNNAAQGIHFLLNQPEVIAPSLVPFIQTYTSFVSSDSEDSYSTNTMNANWASPDYLETISFMGSEDELHLVTNLSVDGYELEISYTDADAYETSFPSRVVLPLSSLHIPISPTSTMAISITLHAEGIDSEERSAKEVSDFDLTLSMEPTEILLPDMNSLEYYNGLLAREKANLAELRRNQTSYKYLLNETSYIKPTNSITQDSTKVMSSTITEENSLHVSGSEALSSLDDLTKSSWPLLDGVAAMEVQLTEDSSSSAMPQHAGTQEMLSSPFSATPAAFITGDNTPDHKTASVSELHGTNSILPMPAMGNQSPATEARDTGSLASLSVKSTTIPLNVTTLLTTARTTLLTTSRAPLSTLVRQYLCNITRSDSYVVRVGFPSGATTGYAKSHIRDILKSEFNRSVELQVLRAPPNFVFRVVTGQLLYTAIAVINTLRHPAHPSPAIQLVTPIYTTPEYRFQVHSVLQFVPSYVDVRLCNFSERIERGLIMAYTEVCHRSQASANFSVQILNISANHPKLQRLHKAPVDIIFAIQNGSGYLQGSEVSAHLRLLSVVEFSFYLGFPVLQIAEPFHYPKLNLTLLLRTSWVKTVLLGVLEPLVGEPPFQARMERRLALLLREVLGIGPRWRRATNVGNGNVQIVKTSRLEGSDHPLEMVYFLEGPSGERFPASTTSRMLNQLDVQQAAIILGYRVQGLLAQPVESAAASPTETSNSNMWIIVGVVVPLVLVVIIGILLYWKLCRSDKLEFQPDAMTAIQQRPKARAPGSAGVQTPSIKGFDFAKLHLGQHGKDDIIVIQEPSSGPVPVKEISPSENDDAPTPKSKASSKTCGAARHRGRISPSDGDSPGSETSSLRESAEENAHALALTTEMKELRTSHRTGPAPLRGTDEQPSSASMFEHVDRMSYPVDGGHHSSNKVQLIAMQPLPIMDQHSACVAEKVLESGEISKEIQLALRHKSEIEHHRNKIRLRAKRKGQCHFPSVDNLDEARMEKHTCRRSPEPEVEPRRSGHGRRRRRHPSGSPVKADRDKLIPGDHMGDCRTYSGEKNLAYVSDADLPLDAFSPSPTDDVFIPCSPPPGPAPAPPTYVAPQPSIEEARQQMHVLLDDAFALVSPCSQRLPAGPHFPIPSQRYSEPGTLPPTAHGLMQRHSVSSAYPLCDKALPSETVYASGALYSAEPPSSARPRPVGGAAGAQIQHLTQVGLSSRMAVYPAAPHPSPSTDSAWAPLQPPALPSTAHSSSLIRAIREELLRLSHKPPAVLTYHS